MYRGNLGRGPLLTRRIPPVTCGPCSVRRKALNRGNRYSRPPILMYQRVQREDVVRIPPERLGEDIDAVSRELTRTKLEGKIGAGKTLTLIARHIERVGEGRSVHGADAVY